MSPIITQSTRDAHLNLDAAARLRDDRLSKASYEQIEAALSYLSG
jgi:hypothetical protein